MRACACVRARECVYVCLDLCECNACFEIEGHKTDVTIKLGKALQLVSRPNASVAYKPIKLSYKRIL